MRKNNLLKKTAWIVLSAVLFGTVAGTVMTGIQIASSGMVSQFFAIVASDEDTVKAEGEAPVSYTHLDVYKRQCKRDRPYPTGTLSLALPSGLYCQQSGKQDVCF